MGRGRVEMKRIDNVASRGATFCKRRAGLLKKAHELAVLCDAHLGVIVFSSSGNLFDYCSPHTSWSELIERYESSSTSRSTNDIQLQEMPAEIESLRQERDHLEASLRRQTGEDLSSLATEEELDDLQQQLESVLRKVRQRTDELLTEQLEESRHKLEESRHKVDILEDQSNFLRHTMNEEDMELQHAAVESEGTLFGGFFPEVEEERGALTSLQLWPELTQPSSLHDH